MSFVFVMRLTKKESPVKIKAFKVSRVKFNILHLGVGTNLALQIIEPKRKTDNGHRVISRGLKLVTKQWMNHYEGWHDKHYFGALKCFFFLLNAQTKGSRPKPSTLWWRWRVPLGYWIAAWLVLWQIYLARSDFSLLRSSICRKKNNKINKSPLS